MTEAPDQVLPPEGSGYEWVRQALMALPNLAKLVGRLIGDPRVPRRRKVFAMAALAYLAWPIDLLPDALPVLGQLDDLVLVVLALHHLVTAVPEEIVREHWDGSGNVLAIVEGVLEWGTRRIPWPLRRAVARYLAGP